jgi:putative FmdB family regulatory protein
MPTYEYRCEACGHEVEYFQSMSAGAKKKCPACSKLRLKRKISAGAGVVFKGGGFYETDYRSESYKKGEKAAKEAQSKPKKDEGKTAKDKGSSDSGSGSKSDA